MAEKEKDPSTIEFADSGYEKQDMSWKALLWIGISIIVGVSAIVLFLNDFFMINKEKEFYEVVLKPTNADLQKLRATEYEILNSYGEIDADQGIYNIPIERAMLLIAREDSMARSRAKSPGARK